MENEISILKNGMVTVESSNDYDKAKALVQALTNAIAFYENAVQTKLESIRNGASVVEADGFQLKVQKRSYKTPLKPLEELLGTGFVSKEVKLSIDTKAIDKYLKEKGEMPEGFTLVVKESTNFSRIK